jgi:hypothetical protein|tara:strand:- start:3073 stop:3180 length:108 start_codon:yes stop_codon:yes gene_type:complete
MIAPDVLQVLLILGMFGSLIFALVFHFFDLEEADE